MRRDSEGLLDSTSQVWNTVLNKRSVLFRQDYICNISKHFFFNQKFSHLSDSYYFPKFHRLKKRKTPGVRRSKSRLIPSHISSRHTAMLPLATHCRSSQAQQDRGLSWNQSTGGQWSLRFNGPGASGCMLSDKDGWKGQFRRGAHLPSLNSFFLGQLDTLLALPSRWECDGEPPVLGRGPQWTAWKMRGGDGSVHLAVAFSRVLTCGVHLLRKSSR